VKKSFNCRQEKYVNHASYRILQLTETASPRFYNATPISVARLKMSQAQSAARKGSKVKKELSKMRSLFPLSSIWSLFPGFVLVFSPVLQRLHAFIIDHIRIHGRGLVRNYACNGGSCEGISFEDKCHLHSKILSALVSVTRIRIWPIITERNILNGP